MHDISLYMNVFYVEWHFELQIAFKFLKKLSIFNAWIKIFIILIDIGNFMDTRDILFINIINLIKINTNIEMKTNNFAFIRDKTNKNSSLSNECRKLYIFIAL